MIVENAEDFVSFGLSKWHKLNNAEETSILSASILVLFPIVWWCLYNGLCSFTLKT